MKTKHAIWTVLIAGILFSSVYSCKKESIKTIPTVTLQSVAGITSNSASTGGEVTADGGASVMARGVCLNTTQNPTVIDTKTSNGTGKGIFTSLLSGLMPGVTYHLRSYGTNEIGTGYSGESTFTTLALAPVLTTTELSFLTATSVKSGGNITNDGGSPITARGVCYSSKETPTIADSLTTDGTGTGSFISLLNGLKPGKTYYVRAYATNSIGTSYGTRITITTTSLIPALTTTIPSSITFFTASGGGNITSDGGSIITARGICWSTTISPTIMGNISTAGNGIGIFTSAIYGLKTGTTYYVRAYATNSIGTAYGNEVSFTTNSFPNCGKVTDIDGNIYITVTIGTQCWMAENLKTTKYRNGDPIPNINDNSAWAALTTGSYCWYDNNSASYKDVYGALYNWLAVVDSRNLAPVGWHVATDEDWTRLTDYLISIGIKEYSVGGELKEAGFLHWYYDNNSATNSTGFTALPGGNRNPDGFSSIDLAAFFWSIVEEGNTTGTTARSLLNNNSDIISYNYNKQAGLSVRCVLGESFMPTLPVLSTTPVTGIAATSASSGGNISSDGGATVTARGVCWSTKSDPTTADNKTSDGTGKGSFPGILSNLASSTTYYIRAYSTNIAGTAYGNNISFTTTPITTVTDIEGNVYSTITIGTQIWMSENLKTTKYSNGDPIPNVTENSSWAALTTGAFCWNHNDASYKATYGALYNWYAVEDIRRIAPLGWHIPSDAEWSLLTAYLDGSYSGGGKLKETGTIHWRDPNSGATNSSGFTALPGGSRDPIGAIPFFDVGIVGRWWSSTASDAGYAWSRGLFYHDAMIGSDNSVQQFGLSVRCVKD